MSLVLYITCTEIYFQKMLLEILINSLKQEWLFYKHTLVLNFLIARYLKIAWEKIDKDYSFIQNIKQTEIDI